MNERSLVQKLEDAKNNRKKLPIPTSWDEGVDCAFNAAIVLASDLAAEMIAAVKDISWEACVDPCEANIEVISVFEAEEVINMYLGKSK